MSTLATHEAEDVLVVSMSDTRLLDDPRIQQAGRELMAVVEGAGQGKLLLNFEHVQFMSSAMIGKLMAVNKACKAKSIELKLCSISPDLMEVFNTMKLHKVLSLYRDEAKALSAFAKKGLFW